MVVMPASSILRALTVASMARSSGVSRQDLRVVVAGAWASACGFRRTISPAERQRARDAAEWLTALADRHESVLAVTHGSFRSLLAAELATRGWACRSAKPWHHWSVWTLAR